MKDYKSYVTRINDMAGHECFISTKDSDTEYLKTLNIPDNIIDFYRVSNPKDIIEINGVRLLPFSEIIEENTNYTPGYILSPRGYCVLATTEFGDVYCIEIKNNNCLIYIASHDEIDEETEHIEDKMVLITSSFHDFLNKFIEGKLVTSFYDLKK